MCMQYTVRRLYTVGGRWPIPFLWMQWKILVRVSSASANVGCGLWRVADGLWRVDGLGERMLWIYRNF